MKPLTGAALAAMLAAGVGRTHAQQRLELRRGEIRVVVPVKGTVVTDGLLRLKSTIEGRIEAVLGSTYTWAGPEAPLGLLADQELAALMDTRQTTPIEVLQERWRKIYRPAEIRCPVDCFVLHVYAQPKKWIQPQALLFEAAKTLRLEGTIDPSDRPWIQKGQILEYWPVNDPERRNTVSIEEISGEWTLKASLNRGRSLNPQTAWEGRIVALVKKDVLRAPTNALIRHQDAVYLPLRVSTGITTKELTEITAGAEELRPFLLLDPKELGAAKTHAPDPLPRPKPVIDDSPYDRPAQDYDDR